MKTSKNKKHKKDTWFIAIRGSYLPNSWQAWALYVPFTLFLVSSLASAVDTKDSAVDAFYMVFTQWVCAAVVMTWIAKKKS